VVTRVRDNQGIWSVVRMDHGLDVQTILFPSQVH
jgi:hypothetical protein